MFLGVILLLLQQVTNVYQQPSYFVPIFVAIWFLGLVLCLGLSVLGFRKMKSVSKEICWFAFAGVFLLLYFLEWFAVIVVIANNNMTLTWLLAAFINLPIVIAAVCAIVGLLKLKDAGSEAVLEEV